MDSVRHGRFLWPGVVSPVSGSYTISHGISPGVAVLVCLPQGNLPAESGDLIITDDVSSVRIPDCKVDKIRQGYEEGAGFVWYLEILDWRWKWRDTGAISGSYNQLDQHGKLRPLTIRSPEELVKLLFKAMGVSKVVIDMPPGLTQSQGQQFNTLQPPWLAGQTAAGSNLPPTGTNPIVDWEGVNPANALESLATQYGRRVVPRLSDYAMMVVRPGFGAGLPPGSVSSIVSGVDSPETPSGVAVLGDYTRYQMRLRLEAVGEDYDGHYKPIASLSYAPDVENRVQISKIQIGAPTTAPGLNGTTYTVTFRFTDNEPFNGTTTEATVTYTATVQTESSVASSLATAINSNGGASIHVNASASGNTITVTSRNHSFWFDMSVSTSNPANRIGGWVHRVCTTKDKPWAFSDPGMWVARATDRLTHGQAVEKAKKTVFRTYRIADVGVLGRGQIFVPGYGVVRRRQQIIPTDHQVEQIIPTPVDLTLRDRNDEPYTANLYNGYSRDKPAEVFGSIAMHLQEPYWSTNTAGNTDETDRIFVPFSIDPDNLLVRFSGPVYIERHGSIDEPPNLVLQCAVMVRNAETNAIERFLATRSNAGAKGLTNFVVRTHQDVQLNVIGTYGNRPMNLHQLLGVSILEADPLARAKYYLDGMQAQYFQTTSQTLVYNGFEPINLDGAITQVTWQFGDDGCSTTASRNTEHEVNVPPYPARRRRELLNAISQQPTEQERRVTPAGNEQQTMWVRPPGYEF